MRKVLRIFFRILAGLFLLLILVLVFLNTPAGKNLIRKQVERYLQEKLPTKVVIGGLDYLLPKKLGLSDVLFLDQQQDTLLSAGKITVQIDVLPLFKKKLHIREVLLSQITSHIYRPKRDSVYNYEYIIQAFAGKEPIDTVTVSQDTSSSSLTIDLDRVKLYDIQFAFNDSAGGALFSVRLDTLLLSMQSMDLNQLHFDIQYLTVAGLQSNFIMDSVLLSSPPDTTMAETPNLRIAAKEIDLRRIGYVQKDLLQDFLLDVTLDKAILQPHHFSLSDQEVAVKDLLLSNAHVYIQYNSKIVTPENPEEIKDTTVSAPWKVLAGNIKLEGIHFSLDDIGTPHAIHNDALDYAHLGIQNFSLHAQKLYYTTDTIAAAIKHLSLNEKHSGLAVKQLKTNFLYHPQGIFLQQLHLQTPYSLIKDQLSLKYSSLDAFSTHPGNGYLKLSLQQSILGVGDILMFAPELRSQEFFTKHKQEKIIVSALVEGQVKDLHIAKFQLAAPGNTTLDMQGRLRGLPDPDKLQYTFEIKKFNTGRQDLSVWMPASLSTSLRLPDYIDLTGSLSGTTTAYHPDLWIHTSDGQIRLMGSVDIADTNSNYQLTLETQKINLGNILQDTSMGYVQTDIYVTGKGFDPKTMEAEANMLISLFEYNKYRYQNISLEAKIKDGLATWQMRSPDPHVDIKLVGSADFNPEYPSVKTVLQIDSIDLHTLHFATEETRLRSTVAMEITRLNPDYPEGHLYITGTTLGMNGVNYFPDEIAIISKPKQQPENNIAIDAGILLATIKGKLPLTQASHLLTTHISRYFASSDTLLFKPPNDSNAYVFTTQDDLFLEAQLIHRPILKVLTPELSRLDTIHITSRLTNNRMDLLLNAPAIHYGSQEINNVRFSLVGKDSALTFKANIQSIHSGDIALWHTALDGNVHGGNVFADLNISDKDSNNRFAISATALQENGNTIVQIGNKFLLEYKDWNVNPNNKIVFSDSGFYIRDLRLQQGKAFIYVHSKEAVPGSPLSMEIKEFDIANLTRMLSQDTLLAGGILNGTIQMESFDPSLSLSGKMNVISMAILGDTLGTLNVQAENSDDYVKLLVKLSSLRNQISLTGKVYPNVQNEKNLDLILDVDRMDLRAIDRFTAGQIRKSRGFINADLKIEGSFEKPIITGKINTKNVSTHISMLNNRFKLPDEQIIFDKEDILLKDYTIEDSLGNKAQISGKIASYLSDNRSLDLRIRTTKWQLMNSTSRNYQDFYGDLFLTSNIQIVGPPTAPKVEGKIDVLKGTDVTISIPEDNVGMQERDGIVEFVNVAKPDRKIFLVKEKDTTDITTFSAPGAEVNLNITLDETATFTVLLDQSSGDFLEVKGKADLNTTMAPNGSIGLAGTYEIMDGKYQMNYNMIRKNFRIESGSTIVFAGEPTDAEANITAIYEANVAPYDLVEKQVTDPGQLIYYKQRLPFEVHMKLKGELLKPEIKFDIILPESKGHRASSEVIDVVQGRLTDLRNNPSELNKQVFSLIILNRFVADNPFESGAGGGIEGIARQSASRFISEQLNKFAGGLVEGLDLTMDLVTSEDYTSGQKRNRTDLNVGASKTINEKLTVSVGNTFQLEGAKTGSSQASSLIPGNITIDYDFTADRRYRMRVYRRNEEAGVRGFVIKTGASFIYTIDYNRFKEIFINRKKERLLREQRRKERMAADSSRTPIAPEKPR